MMVVAVKVGRDKMVKVEREECWGQRKRKEKK